jgi:hypothetical protein
MMGEDVRSAKIRALKKAGDRMFRVRANSKRMEPADLPQSLRMAALHNSHAEAKEKTKPEEKSTEKNLGGDTQVTVVSDALSDTLSDISPPKLAAGASPHAPQRPKTKQKGDRFSFRMPEGMKPMLEAKAAAAGSYPSAYVLALIAADLRIPIDEEKLQRGRELQEQIAALTVAINRQGNNINQMAKATHEGKPSPLTRPEISQLLQQHSAAVSAILRLGFAS